MPTTALYHLRRKVIEKVYAPRAPTNSQATGAGSTTTIVDNLLAPSTQVEDFIGAWIVGNAAVYTDQTLNGAMTAAATTFVYAGTGDPVAATDYVMIDDEIMLVTAVDTGTNTATVTRAQAGTTAAAHITASLVLHFKPQPTMVQNAAGASNPGGSARMISRVSTVDFSGSTSTLTIAPALADALGAGGKYEIHYKFSPQAVNNKVNEILENLRRIVWEPLTICPDGSMEAADAGSWDDSLSSAAVAKQASGVGVVFGRNSLRVTNSGANGYAQSQPMYLPPQTKVVVAALATIISGTGDATLNLLSSTNGSTYTSVETAVLDNVSATGNVLLVFSATVPAGARDIIVRLAGGSANNVIDWNFVSVLPTNRKLWAFPTLFERHHDFLGLHYLRPGTKITLGDNDNAYHLDGYTMQKFTEAGVFYDENAVVPYRVDIRGQAEISSSSILFAKGWVNYARLNDDVTTTTAPEDVVVDLAAADLMDDLAQEDRDEGRIEQAKSREDRANVLRTRLGPRMAQIYKPAGVVHGALRRLGGD